MMKLWFPSKRVLPTGFRYPDEYLLLGKQPVLPDLYPWRFLGETPTEIEDFIKAMRGIYTDKLLIPFARFEDSANGDLACFDGDDKSGNPKIYFHVYGYQKTIPSWDKRYHLENFSEWLRVAGQESARYKAERAEDENE